MLEVDVRIALEGIRTGVGSRVGNDVAGMIEHMAVGASPVGQRRVIGARKQREQHRQRLVATGLRLKIWGAEQMFLNSLGHWE